MRLIGIILIGATLTACTSNIRMTNDAETRAILSSITSSLRTTKARAFCVDATLTPPLQHRLDIDRQFPEGRSENLKNPAWSVYKDAIRNESVPLPLDQRKHLQRLYDAALDFTASDKEGTVAAPLVPATVMVADKRFPRCNEEGAWIEQYSRPVLAGGIAFVEVAVSCGAMCGYGEIRALKLEGLQWREVAIQPTFVV